MMKRAAWFAAAIGLGTAIVGTAFTTSATAASKGYRLIKVADAKSPMAVIWHPKTRVPVVVEKEGTLRSLAGKPLTPIGMVLDLTKEVSTGGEQGLLGAAFSNDGSLIYVNLTNTDGDTEIREYQFANDVAAASSKRVLLTIDQPYGNHNGGHIIMDSKGLLWIGMGDGGSGGDPENYAQNLDSLLGKMLRIDPRPNGSSPYTIPADNPFVQGGGKPEIWAYGLRNPWRYDLDESTGRLFIGDVGQNEVEEVNMVTTKQAGANFGWKLREGSRAYNGGKKPTGAIDPITEYRHSDGCSITGGVVYRGTQLSALRGKYLYGDYCKGWIAAVGPGVGGKGWITRKLGITMNNLVSFNRAPWGDVWVTSADGTISSIARQ
jgi:glucose/arabinose dehydrogenase